MGVEDVTFGKNNSTSCFQNNELRISRKAFSLFLNVSVC